MKYLAFDLDGVFIPDLDMAEYTDESFQVVWRHLKPIFVPKEPIIIITARKLSMQDFTMAWLQKHQFCVEEIHFVIGDVEDFRPEVLASHKCRVLNSMYDRVEAYIESDLEIVRLLQQYGLPFPIVHFGSHIIRNTNLGYRSLDPILNNGFQVRSLKSGSGTI